MLYEPPQPQEKVLRPESVELLSRRQRLSCEQPQMLHGPGAAASPPGLLR
jgi:hypothetical protein